MALQCGVSLRLCVSEYRCEAGLEGHSTMRLKRNNLDVSAGK